MDDIFLTVNWDRDPPTVLALVREKYSTDSRVFLCDVNCRAVDEHFESLPCNGSPEWMASYRQTRRDEFMRRAAALGRLLANNAAEVLDDADRTAIADTEGDRQLVRAIAAGAVMDPETGRIPGYDPE